MTITRVINSNNDSGVVTAWINLPENFDVADVQLDSILLNGNAKIINGSASINKPYNRLKVQFIRKDLLDTITETGDVELTINGQLKDTNIRFAVKGTVKKLGVNYI